jgi:hypothetical protein
MQNEKPDTDKADVSDNGFPAEFYGIITQLMLFVHAMDEDYMKSKEKEKDR